MAKIFAFKGVRPVKNLAEKVAELPYDVVSSQEAAKLAEGNPYSFFHVSKAEIDLPADMDQYDARVYQKGRDNLHKFMAEKILVQDSKPMLYVYRQIMNGRAQIGLVACASVDDYVTDVIKKHELTRADKEEDRTRHLDVLGANSGPVFLTYRAVGEIDALIGKVVAGVPEYDFTTGDKVQHTFWLVSDDAVVGQLVKLIGHVPVLYVADGHHRSASAARAREWRRERNPHHNGNEEYNRFLAVLFPHNQLFIMSYNRVVKDLNGHTKEQFLNLVREKFQVTDDAAPTPSGSKQFSMYLDGRWYGLAAKEGSFNAADPVASLDCSILQNNLLSPVLGIGDPRRDKRIDFVGGIRGTGELERRVNSGEMKVAFSLYPVTIQQLMDVSDAGLIMPPKSTWFEPKLRSGMVVHLIGE